MQMLSRAAVFFSLALLFALPVCAQEKAEKAQAKGKKAAPAPQAVTAVLKQLESAGLSEEQSKKVKEISAEYTPKLQATQKKVAEILTAEQKKARQEAAAKNKADGVKGKAAAEAVQAALKLTADQQAAFDAADKEAKAVGQAYREAVLGVLTEEQKGKVNFAGGKKAKKAK